MDGDTNSEVVSELGLEDEQEFQASSWKDVVLNYVDEDENVDKLLGNLLGDKDVIKGEDPLGIVKSDVYIKRTNVNTTIYADDTTPVEPKPVNNKSVWKKLKKLGGGASKKEKKNLAKFKADATSLSPTSKNNLNFTSSNFDPVLFLKKVHFDTSYIDIMKGYSILDTKVKGDRSSQLQNLVRERFDDFVRCRDAIDKIEEVLLDSRITPVENGQLGVESLLSVATKSGTSILDPFNEDRQEVEKLTTASKVLKRFFFMFNLPGTIEADNVAGNHEKIVTDYKKANQLISQSLHIPSLKRVFEDTQKVISEFRLSLYHKLEAPNTPLEDLEHMIGIICELQLGDTADEACTAVWYLLWHRYDYISNLLLSAANKYFIDVAQILHEDESSPKTPGENKTHESQNKDELIGQLSKSFVFNLSEIMMDNVPDLWSVSQYSLKLLWGQKKDMLPFQKLKNLPPEGEFTTPSIDNVYNMINDIGNKYVNQIKKVVYGGDVILGDPNGEGEHVMTIPFLSSTFLRGAVCDIVSCYWQLQRVGVKVSPSASNTKGNRNASIDSEVAKNTINEVDDENDDNSQSVSKRRLSHVDEGGAKFRVLLTVVSARELRKGQKLGVQNPCVKIKLNSHYVKTKVCESSTSIANWGEKFILSTSDLAKSTINISIVSKTLFNKEVIGTTEIPLSQFNIFETSDKFFPVYDKLGVTRSGELRLQIRIVSTVLSSEVDQELASTALVSRSGSTGRRSSSVSSIGNNNLGNGQRRGSVIPPEMLAATRLVISGPSQLEAEIMELAKNCTEKYIEDTVQLAKNELEKIHLTEDWVLGSYTDRSNGSSRITSLPNRVQRLLSEMLSSLKGVLIATDWFSDLISHKTVGCLSTLSVTLKSLVSPEMVSSDDSSSNVLLSLSNTIYIRSQVIPNIHILYDSLFGDNDETKFNQGHLKISLKKLGEVENYYVGMYIDIWNREINKIIDSKLKNSNINNENNKQLLKNKGLNFRKIRSYTKDIIYLLTSIHDAIYNSIGFKASAFKSRGLGSNTAVLEHILFTLCEGIFISINKCIKEMDVNLSPINNTHIQIELLFFTKAMPKYYSKSEESNKAYKESIALLTKLGGEEIKKDDMNDVINQALSSCSMLVEILSE